MLYVPCAERLKNSRQCCADHQNHHTFHKPSANPSTMPPAQDCGIFTHTPLTVEGRAIRLLDLLPSSDPSSEIQCKLWNVDLDERPSYKALSYVWGDPENTVQILVDGKSYNVTVNCEAALYRLRETHESSLWIDVSRSGIAVFDALVSCKLMGRKPLYISTDRGSRTP